MPPPASCVSCGAVLSGPHCSQCGQRARAHRLTLGRVAADALRQVTSLDRGLGRTLLDLVQRPAGMAADYWRGRTVPYVGPVRFFLVCVTVVQVTTFALGLAPDFVEAFAEGFDSARRTGAEAVDTEAMLASVQRFWVLGLAGLVPFGVLWGRVVFRRAGRTLAEHAVAQLYFMGVFVLALGVSLFGGHGLYDYVSNWLGDTFSLVTLVGAVGLYLWSVGATFGQRRWTGLAGALAVFVLTYGGYVAVWGIVAGFRSAHGG